MLLFHICTVCAHLCLSPSVTLPQFFAMLDSVYFYAGLHERTFYACFLHFGGLELVYKLSAIKRKIALKSCLYLEPLTETAAVPPLEAAFMYCDRST